MAVARDAVFTPSDECGILLCSFLACYRCDSMLYRWWLDVAKTRCGALLLSDSIMAQIFASALASIILLRSWITSTNAAHPVCDQLPLHPRVAEKRMPMVLCIQNAAIGAVPRMVSTVDIRTSFHNEAMITKTRDRLNASRRVSIRLVRWVVSIR